MRFIEWLKSKQNEGNEAIDLVAPTMLTEEVVLDQQVGTVARAADVARARWGASDEIVDAVREVYNAYLVENCVREPPPRDPMGLPYVPGARTTLADARLQLVCAVVASTDPMLDLNASEPVRLADEILEAMRCRPCR